MLLMLWVMEEVILFLPKAIKLQPWFLPSGDLTFNRLAIVETAIGESEEATAKLRTVVGTRNLRRDQNN